MAQDRHDHEQKGQGMKPGFKRHDVDHDPHSNRPGEAGKDVNDRHTVPGAAHAGSDAGAEEDNNP